MTISDIIETEDQDEGPWAVEQTICDRCNHQWVAVYPIGGDGDLECSQCGYLQPASVTIEDVEEVTVQ